MRKLSEPRKTLASAASDAARGFTHNNENLYTPITSNRIAAN
jgi:hypothetical protein